MKKTLYYSGLYLSLLCVVPQLAMGTTTTNASQSQYPEWTAEQAYPQGSMVTYQGNIYLAQWWAEKGEAPKQVVNTWDSPWLLQGEYTPPPPPPDNGDNPPPPDNGDNPPPPPSEQMPGVPSIDYMTPNQASGSQVPLKWNLYWGVPGSSWEVWSDGSRAYQSSDFTKNEANAQAGSAQISLTDGKHNLVVKLCNGNQCSSSTATEVTVGADKNAKPTAPQIDWMDANQSSSKPITLSWNMYWGQVGSSWEVWSNGEKLTSSSSFTKNEANAQAGTTQLTLKDGKYDLVAKLCNGDQCSSSATQTINVGGGGSDPTPQPEPTPLPVPTAPTIVGLPANSESSPVTLNWEMTGGTVGTSWEVWDGTNKISTSTQFTENTATSQKGSASLNLSNGSHPLSVKLCNQEAKCSTSETATINIEKPVAPTPGTPQFTNVPPTFTNGQISVEWKMQGGPNGTYWELWNGNSRMTRQTSFDQNDQNGQAGSVKNLTVSNGTYTLTVKLCNADDICSTSSPATTVVSGNTAKAFFVSYYPTWYEPYYSAYDARDKTKQLPDDEVMKKSLLAGGVPDYVTHVVLAFSYPNPVYNGVGTTDGDLKTAGITLQTNSASLRESIRILKERTGAKVILAVGGATYNNGWTELAAEADKPLADTKYISAFKKMILELGLDGLDVDYEKGGTDAATIDEYTRAIKSLRRAVDAANAEAPGKILTLAGWSTGADCTPQTQEGFEGCEIPCPPGTTEGTKCYKKSYWGGNAGRERLVLQGKGAASMIDIVSVMSYDADYQHFDPIVAYDQYRQIAPGKPVALGVQPSPDEGWGAARLTVKDLGTKTGNNNQCTGNVILYDQYGVEEPGTFSVERFAKAVAANPGDGMMMWSLWAYRNMSGIPAGCADTVTDVGRGVSEHLKVGTDRTLMIDYNTAINYGR